MQGVSIEHRPASRPPTAPRERGAALAVPTLVVWMLVAIGAVAGLAYWDAKREAQAVLREFADDQAWLSEALAHALSDRLTAVAGDARDAAQTMSGDALELPGGLRLSVVRPGGARSAPAGSGLSFDVVDGGGAPVRAEISLADLLAPLRPFERTDSRVLVRQEGTTDLVAANGLPVQAEVVARGFAEGARSVQLSYEEASALGLPARTAIVGLARTKAGRFGPWEVATVASAQSERDRAERSEWRELLGVGLVGALVLAFGGAALRTRTTELALRHTLTIQAIETEHDERLVRADKLATMGALATGVAHEISTPLGVILARAEQIVARAKDDEKTRRSGELIVAESERINTVIRGFLELARGATPRLEATSPAELADEAASLVAHRFAKAGVRLVRPEPNRGLPAVACDRRLFEQVLVNLLLNACDACEAGGLVEVSLHADAEHVTFVVSDDGVGIDAETAARATEPFFTTKTEGAGLGLAIANEIVKHHHGSLSLSPRPRAARRAGGGTDALVRLPRSGTGAGKTAGKEEVDVLPG